MAILHNNFLGYLSTTLTTAMDNRKPAYSCDPLFAILEFCREGSSISISLPNSDWISGKIMPIYHKGGIAEVMKYYFKKGITDQFVDVEVERQIIALKMGFPSLPATTCSIIMRGFEVDLSDHQVLNIFASHGLCRGMKKLAGNYDFIEINRRIKEFNSIMKNPDKMSEFIKRFNALYSYIHAPSGKQEQAIRQSKIRRSLFFHYWKRFCKYGLLGLADSGSELFRSGKVGLKNEARLVISKLQKPARLNIDFVKMLETKNIKINTSSISMIFKRWRVKDFQSHFVDNLKRLETDFQAQEKMEDECYRDANPVRLVDSFYLPTLEGLAKHGMPTDAPGLFILWSYLEKLEIFPVLSKMGLTVLPAGQKKGYSWFDLFMLNIGRIFYGISNYSAVAEQPDPTLPFFAGLVKSPCNDTFLNGLESKITEKETFMLRQWLVRKSYDLGLIKLQKTALDFHQIDMDVIFDKIRNFGKGPSPNKKICYNEFRPHIAWDTETGCLIVAEFRKSSARGTTTAIPFIKDYMFPEFKDCFDTVYVDSEYTGKNLWKFILDKDCMGASLTACLKQNAFVRNARDKFLRANEHHEGFWQFYDDNHVYSSDTFELAWQVKKSDEKKNFKLICVIKKNINNGSLRCFGTSKENIPSRQILMDYSNRWAIENGIKDLIGSYYMDNCPGTRPHLADVHFLIISICRILYKMISNDLKDDCKNYDGTTKTLSRMREMLFRQGAGMVYFRNKTFEVKFLNAFSIPMTEMLYNFFQKNRADQPDGLTLLNGAKLNFSMQVPHGEEYRNSLDKQPLFLLGKN